MNGGWLIDALTSSFMNSFLVILADWQIWHINEWEINESGPV